MRLPLIDISDDSEDFSLIIECVGVVWAEFSHNTFLFVISDESEEVEQETQSLISVIENIIGESIQQYF